ncbi:MAG: prepilin peptidase [Actinobacteria bacterium]|nr:prepilin peptidase [Actinomycetota bacterium]
MGEEGASLIPEWFEVGFAAVLGLIFGSFATAFAYRVPRRESLGGRSKCPNCDTTIRAADNVPVISYLLLRGKCRNCGQVISPRYPLIELTSGALFALAAWKFGPTLTGITYASFFWILLVLTVIDLEFKLLPNRIVFPALYAGWALLVADALLDTGFAMGDPAALREAALGAVVFGGFLFLVAFIYPAGMGMGDVKLALVLGSFLGYLGGIGLAVTGMFLSFLFGGFLGALIAVARGGGRKTQIPFGPWLALGTVTAVLFGEGLLDWYLELF